MEDARNGWAARARKTLFATLQWMIAAFFLLMTFSLLIDIHKLDIAGAPVALFWMAIVAMAIVTLLLSPPLFYRLPRKIRIASYVAAIAAFIPFVNYQEQMQPLWEKTDEGKKEVAERAEADRKAAIEREREAARLKAEEEQVAQEARDQKQADIEAQGQALCESLQQNVIDLSKTGRGAVVIEINDIAVVTPAAPTALKCTGTAITSQGDRSIDFGVETTPQGKQLVTMQLR